jgi:hypothetical protein
MAVLVEIGFSCMHGAYSTHEKFQFFLLFASVETWQHSSKEAPSAENPISENFVTNHETRRETLSARIVRDIILSSTFI